MDPVQKMRRKLAMRRFVRRHVSGFEALGELERSILADVKGCKIRLVIEMRPNEDSSTWVSNEAAISDVVTKIHAGEVVVTTQLRIYGNGPASMKLQVIE